MTDAARRARAGLAPDSGELVAFGLLMDRALEALAAAGARAETAEAELAAVADRLGAAVSAAAAGERKRISDLADRSGAVCTGDEGTSFCFSALLGNERGEADGA